MLAKVWSTPAGGFTIPALTKDTWLRNIDEEEEALYAMLNDPLRKLPFDVDKIEIHAWDKYSPWELLLRNSLGGNKRYKSNFLKKVELHLHRGQHSLPRTT